VAGLLAPSDRSPAEAAFRSDGHLGWSHTTTSGAAMSALVYLAHRLFAAPRRRPTEVGHVQPVQP
jgi:hypothetical protein